MYKSNLKSIYLLSLAGLFNLAACGGGGGDTASNDASDSSKQLQSSQAASTNTTSPETTQTSTTQTSTTQTQLATPSKIDQVPEKKLETIEDINIEAKHSLSSTFNLDIEIKLKEVQRAYFSLCDDYRTKGDSYVVNYDSCLYRAPIQNGQLQKRLMVANHNTQLIGAIWFYDGSQPKYQVWQKQNNPSANFTFY
ncbi:hypothetical protein C2869_02405 [Saccharobesus litoralis]|uniref:Lipoprotein n=1 Tax=Saccharobesus litoralis TaxID=2172099 RepID=A0A2S0VMN0_9ALTE|nr:hypothetical protein [Saccharobesus litoralis]AWB65360.1 hypothetical protein C2869_02405 [Saccharobesus litoralis]